MFWNRSGYRRAWHSNSDVGSYTPTDDELIVAYPYVGYEFGIYKDISYFASTQLVNKYVSKVGERRSKEHTYIDSYGNVRTDLWTFRDGVMRFKREADAAECNVIMTMLHKT